jgi:DNA-binding NarL/FixJ family response regulator
MGMMNRFFFHPGRRGTAGGGGRGGMGSGVMDGTVVTVASVALAFLSCGCRKRLCCVELDGAARESVQVPRLRVPSRSVTQVLRVALVNDFEVIVRGLAGMLDPFRDRVLVVELDVGSNPEYRVDIALFDTYGHSRGGVDRVRSLATDPRVGAVVVYAWALPSEQLDAVLAAGARGVLSKSTPAEALADTMAAIDGGEIVVSRVFSRPRERNWPGHDFALTARESEVAAFLAEGLSNHAIGDALFISEHTVKSHLKAIFQKTGAASRTQVIARITEDPDFRRVRRAG